MMQSIVCHNCFQILQFLTRGYSTNLAPSVCHKGYKKGATLLCSVLYYLILFQPSSCL